MESKPYPRRPIHRRDVQTIVEMSNIIGVSKWLLRRVGDELDECKEETRFSVPPEYPVGHRTIRRPPPPSRRTNRPHRTGLILTSSGFSWWKSLNHRMIWCLLSRTIGLIIGVSSREHVSQDLENPSAPNSPRGEGGHRMIRSPIGYFDAFWNSCNLCFLTWIWLVLRFFLLPSIFLSSIAYPELNLSKCAWILRPTQLCSSY